MSLIELPADPAAETGRSERFAAREQKAFKYIIDLIYEHSGIRLHDGKEQLIRARLGKRMRHHGIDSLDEYIAFLRNCPDESEFTVVVDALTTNFTNFFREEGHFEFMVKQALPETLAKGQRRFQVWSAASSSGEEPYTIAMYLAEHFPLAQAWDWRVEGSDISTKALAAAQRGVYSAERVSKIPDEWLRKYFQKGIGNWEGYFRVKAALSERVAFRQINLIKSYEHQQPFEVIFCRNVMIYFDRPTQEQLINHLCRFLSPKGYLLIGNSESLNGLKVPLRCLRPSIYQHA